MSNPEGRTIKDDSLLEKVRSLLPDFVRGDGTVNYRGLAQALGTSRTTLRAYADAVMRENRKATQEAYTPDLVTAADFDTKARVRVRAYNPNSIKELPARRVLAIGDTHVKPGMDLSHFTWIGRYVAETRPDNVIHIGDFFDFESCEFHTAPGSATHGRRPAFQEDKDSGYDALELYHKEVEVGSIPHDIVYGNHEYRVERYEEAAPNLAGTLCIQRDEMFARYRWRVTPYKYWLFMEGVGFSHVPQNIMGKPIGGKYPENTIGNLSTHSIVFGHTHRYNHVTVPKIGVNNAITVTNLGSAMPYGYLPNYVEGATTAYTYGIVELRLRGGRAESAKFISMLELAEKFS